MLFLIFILLESSLVFFFTCCLCIQSHFSLFFIQIVSMEQISWHYSSLCSLCFLVSILCIINMIARTSSIQATTFSQCFCSSMTHLESITFLSYLMILLNVSSSVLRILQCPIYRGSIYSVLSHLQATTQVISLLSLICL